jgi:glycolate oxidase iron-sulfur subunit
MVDDDPLGLTGFDGHHPPALDLISDCVHCGFCLASCPTYELWGEEMDSPRGRIDLMRQGLTGEPITPSMVSHFDRCLGCMACLPACPSGVQYDKLIEATRAQVERLHDRSLRDRMLRGLIFAVFPYRRRLRVLTRPMWLYQRSGLQQMLRRSRLYSWLPATLRAMEAVAPPVTRVARIGGFTPAFGARRAVVGLLTGCVQSVFFSDVNAATVRVLAAEGCDVVVPRRQGCCGALSAHNGREGEAVRFARALIDAFATANVDTVIVNSAGCGSTMKEYAYLLRDDEQYSARAAEFAGRTRDIAEFLDELGPQAPRYPLHVSVAYHDACHLSNAQGVRAQPRRLLEAIPGLSLREINDGQLCCGSAGIYNLLQPAAADELAQRKAANVLATGARLLVTANPGCLMQVSAALATRGGTIGTAHTIVVLDASIGGLDAETAFGLVPDPSPPA